MNHATVKLYRDKFVALQTTKPFYIDTEPKTWYKQKFKFRINFRYAEKDKWIYSEDSPLRFIRKAAKKIDPKCRTRWEYTMTVFTNSTELLDFILAEPKMYNWLNKVTYIDEQYVRELQNLDGVAVDVKFVSHKKYNPEFPYLVEFEWHFGHDRNSTNWRQTRQEKVNELYNYCKENSDSLQWTLKHIPFSYGQKINVYARDAEHIPLLYVMFGQIEKVWKLVKKEKNNEQ